MLNNFKYLISFIILFCSIFIGFCVFASANHLEIIYPHNNAIIRANSTFFIGNTNPKATLTINGQSAKVYANGAFVRVFNLNKGKNTIELKSVLNNDIKIKKITLTVPEAAKASTNKEPFKECYQTLIVTSDETPLRTTPYGDRLTPVKKGVIFNSIGTINNHYKIKLNENKYAYIIKNSSQIYDKEYIKEQKLNQIFFDEDSKYIIIKIPVKQAALTEINTNLSKISVRLMNTDLNFKNYIIKSPYIKIFNFAQDTFNITLSSTNLNGYDYYYKDNNFILKIRKPFSSGLRGKTIVIDPGHGGKECGSIGPTGVPEKDINLSISKYLQEALEKKGATVIMTRYKDEYVDLYERVKIAQIADADIIISIHNNALPDGGNPYITHGTTTYYYHAQAIKLATSVQNNLLKATGFNNLGIKHSSLVLTRPTLPIGILVEVGFMINPFEYEKLLMPSNQKAYAIGILNGLEEYFNLQN